MKEYLNTVGYITDSDIPNDDGQVYQSREDNSYITRVGMEDDGTLKFLKDHNIGRLQSNNGQTACIGFSYDKQKWYGWSHRAIYGFGIGSEVKKGDCAYSPKDKEDFLESMVRFWSNENHKNTKGVHFTNKEKEKGVYVEWEYDEKTPNKKIRGTKSGSFANYPEKYGRGEWTAKTLEDAKEMAFNFASGVS